MSCLISLCCFRNADMKTPLFSLKGTSRRAKIVKVYDGDTVHAVFYFGSTLYRWKCRLTGIDTPEIKTNCQGEYQAAVMARDTLRKMVLNKLVTIKCDKFDKYGRLLITIHKSGVNINKFMVRQGFAYEYDGGTKKKFKLNV